ncbi:MAG: SAM-dependent methyltransferase [Myxococcota bacterium]
MDEPRFNNPLLVDLPDRRRIEPPVRLSESKIWSLNQRFYAAEGVGAWLTHGIPSYITSNAGLARAYARIMFQYVETVAHEGEGPVHIVELGSGTGRFAFLVLTHLLEFAEAYGEPTRPFRYVMTDFSDQNLPWWRAHPELAPFVASGQLDFALYDGAVGPIHDRLMVADEPFVESIGRAPAIFIANYVLDSLPHDLFFIEEEGELRELHVGLTSLHDLDAEAFHLDGVELFFERGPVTDAPYSDPELSRVVVDYAAQLGGGPLSVPTSAAEGVARFERLTQGRFLFLTADKGPLQPDPQMHAASTHLDHHGSTSMNVNLDLLAEIAASRGARCVRGSSNAVGLSLLGLVMGPGAASTASTARAWLQEASPLAAYSLKEVEPGTLPPTTVLGVLQLVGWDPDMVSVHAEALVDAAKSDDPKVRDEVRTGLLRAERLVFTGHQHRDNAFAFGRVWYALDEDERARNAFAESIRTYGVSAPRLFNFAISLYAAQEDPAVVRRCLEDAIALDPGLDVAHDALARLNHHEGPRQP